MPGVQQKADTSGVTMTMLAHFGRMTNEVSNAAVYSHALQYDEDMPSLDDAETPAWGELMQQQDTNSCASAA